MVTMVHAPRGPIYLYIYAAQGALKLSEWIGDLSHQKEFSSKLDKDFSKLLSSRLTASSNRERMWRDYFLLRSSEAFIINSS